MEDQEEMNVNSNEEATNVEDHVPTDEELSSAFDSFLDGYAEKPVEDVTPPEEEEEVTSDQVTEPVQKADEDDLDNLERSRLGRKVAKLYDELKNTASKSDIEKLMERIDTVLEGKKEPEEEPYFDLSTKEGVDEYLDYREKKKAQEADNNLRKQEKEYVDTYLGQMKSFISTIEDEKVRRMVYAEMVKKDGEFNIRHTGKPVDDVVKNFTGALLHVNKVVSYSPKTVFDKTKTNLPNGISGVQTTTNSVARSPDLDDIAADFVRRTGMSEEDVLKALEGDMSENLRGKVKRI